ncbi:enhanced intracellular survival protein Eis [Pseudanabaena sp. PCC 6802]|uniref:GNAT family N-acetyltransferase n=1 Tax=Pseudanabaena sp. PCC 6802 TaxID=118173 RepID=UPI00034A02A9|nr:GNAT family N-acetyltransferase [Pseudanabaena sp. PCC 6802]
MEIRKLAPEERSELLHGFDYAFFEWTGRAIAEDDTEGINSHDVLGVFVDGRLASALINYKFQQSIRGAVKGMGGIGGVWTYPEYRARGFVRALIKAALHEMHELGIATSMLIPFKDRFYANFGYVTSNANLEVKVPIAALSYTLHSNIAGNWQVERVNASTVRDEFLTFMLDLAPSQHHGITIPINATAKQWQEVMDKRLCVRVQQDGKLAAIAIYRINSDYRAAPSDRLIQVFHMYWRTLEARTKLFSFFALHRDQVRYISMDLPMGLNFYQWFQNLNDPCATKVAINPYMVRVTDVEKAIADLPAPTTGKVTIAVSDSFCGWNDRTFAIFAKDGKLTAQRSETSEPDAIATIQAISALVYGTVNVEELEYRDWLKISNPQARATLSSWFPTMMLYSTFKF